MTIATHDALRVLRSAYANPLQAAREAAAVGQPVIGYVGNTVPVELILAAGAFAVQVTGAADCFNNTPAADEWLEGFFDPDVHAIFEQSLRGDLHFLSALIVPRSTEPFHKLYLSLREVERLGRAPEMPSLVLYDMPHTQSDVLRRYGLQRTRDLAAVMGEITGIRPDDASAGQAIRKMNDGRKARQALQRMRRAFPCGLSSELAQVLNGAGAFMPPHRYTELLPAALKEGARCAPPSGPRLLVKGVPLDHTALHRLVDLAGAVIVAEDDSWGTRAAWPLVAEEGDPFEALFAHYHAEVPCPRIHPREAREAWFRQTIDDTDIDGVVFNLPAPDDVHGWDFPSQRSQLQQRGIPFLQLREDVRDRAALGRAETSLRDFISTLTPRT